MGPSKQYTKIRNAEDTLFDSCMSQLSNDMRYSRGSSVEPSLYHKQPDGPFSALEIIGGAALTDVLRLQIYMMYCQNPAYYKWLDDPINAPEIIREAALTDVLRLHIYGVLLESCIS